MPLCIKYKKNIALLIFQTPPTASLASRVLEEQLRRQILLAHCDFF